MAKKSSGSSNREAKVAKAGKRSGNQVYPAPISSERRAGKDQGEQQFVSKEQLTQVREDLGWGPDGTFIAWNDKTGQFVYKTKKVSIPADYIFDPSRGRVVYSPSFKEKSDK